MALEVPISKKLVSGIKLKDDPIQFDGDCIDPFAKIVIAEALDYAIETSLRRLESAGKVISDVAIKGYPALQTVQGIRDALNKAPTCARTLTPDEQDKVAFLLAKEKKEIKVEKGKPKPKARAKELTAEVWNTLSVPERVELATAAGMEGKLGSKGFGYFTTSDIAKLQQAYLEPAKPKAKAKAKVEPEPKAEKPIFIIAIKERDKKDPKVLVQTGWGVVDEKGLITRRISVDEGAKLLGEGKARIF
jgi:hypothetical protein